MMKNNRFYSVHSSLTSIIIILFGTGLVGTASICQAQDSPWTTKADLNIARYQQGVCVVNGKIYAIGGEPNGNGCGSPGTKSVEEYDPLTNIWTEKADMPTARESLSASVVNGKIYAIGGSRVLCDSILGTVEVYDPQTNTWDTTKTNMPTARRGLSTVVLEGEIYAIGGYIPSTSTYLTTVEKYDPLSDTWITKAPMLEGRGWFGTTVVDGKIIAMGGVAGEIASNTIEEYDPEKNEWTFMEGKMPVVVADFGSSYVNGLIYIFGGLASAHHPPKSDVRAYNPISGTWKLLSPMTTARFVRTVELNGNIYLIGGSSTSYRFTPIATVEAYNPHNDLLRLVDSVAVDKSSAIAGIDSVWISTKISDPTGITLFAEINAPDQTPVDSVELFDDGNHNDGSAGDSIFANSWPVLSMEERQYFIDLKVTLIDSDTVNQHFNNMASFTTKGPVTIDSTEIEGEANPGDIVAAKLYFKNNGKTATIENIHGSMTILDSCITNANLGLKPTLSSLSAGEVKQALWSFSLKIADNCPMGQIPVQVDIYEGGNFYWADTFYVDVNLENGVTDKNTVGPDPFVLHQNYPNPFNSTTTIQYQVPKRSEVKLTIFNLLGEHIATLVDHVHSMGTYSVQWNGTDDTGQGAASGVYLYRLQTNQFVQVKELVLLR